MLPNNKKQALSEKQFRIPVESFPHPVAVHSEGKFVYVNDATLKLMKAKSSKELIGEPAIDIVHPDYRKIASERIKHLYKTGETAPFIEEKLINFRGEEIIAEVTGILIDYDHKPSILVTIRDITEKKNAEEEILTLNKILNTLYKISQDVIIETDINKLLNKVCDRIIKELDIRFVWIGAINSESVEVKPIAQAGFEKDYLKKARITYDKSKYGKGPTGTAIRTGKPSVMRFIDTDNRFKPWREIASQRGYRSSASFPMFTKGKCMGALNLYSQSSDAFGAIETDLYGTLADYVAIALKTITKEKELRESEEKFRSLAEESPNMIFINKKGKVVYANKKCEEVLGYTRKELYSGNFNFMTLFPPEHKDTIIKKFREHREGRDVPTYEFELLKKNGGRLNVIQNTQLIDYEGERSILGIVTDITELKHAENSIIELNEKLEQKVQERTEQLEVANMEIKVLLREMHHRVKNNLQIISSLLNLQSANVNNEELSRALKDSQSRIETMALIHESLYKKETLSRINLRKYLEDLTNDRIRANSKKGFKVISKIDVPEVKLNISTIVPIGLLINELVTNSLKHAFQNIKEGRIKISLKKLTNNKYNLLYSDNGTGFPKDTDNKRSKSLGIELINSFIDQIGGTFVLKTGKKGVEYKITFRE